MTSDEVWGYIIVPAYLVGVLISWYVVARDYAKKHDHTELTATDFWDHDCGTGILLWPVIAFFAVIVFGCIGINKVWHAVGAAGLGHKLINIGPPLPAAREERERQIKSEMADALERYRELEKELAKSQEDINQEAFAAAGISEPIHRR